MKQLTDRQALFKQAALEAKKAGNMEEAKGSNSIEISIELSIEL